MPEQMTRDRIATVGRLTFGLMHWNRPMSFRARWGMLGWRHWSLAWRWQ